jgi:hypothetical protein
MRFDEVTDLTKTNQLQGSYKITVFWDVTLLCKRHVLLTGTNVTGYMVSNSRRLNLSTDH